MLRDLEAVLQSSILLLWLSSEDVEAIREIKTFRHLVSASVTKACRFAIASILLALIVFFSVKVTAESSIGFPPSPGFPESSAAKELSGLDDVLSIYFLVVTGNLSDEHWLHWLGFFVWHFVGYVVL